MTTYYTPASPTVTGGFFFRPESRILVGTQSLYDSLETTSWTYTVYEASIGLKNGQSFELGQVADLSWQHTPEYEAVEGFNIADDSVYEVTGEETMVTIEIQEFHPQILEVAIGTGNRYVLGTEQLLTFGGGCTMRNRPISVEFTNQACETPSSADTSNGITGGVLTIYDAFVSSGIEMSLGAREVATSTFEFTARPVTARANGNRLGSLYLY